MRPCVALSLRHIVNPPSVYLRFCGVVAWGWFVILVLVLQIAGLWVVLLYIHFKLPACIGPLLQKRDKPPVHVARLSLASPPLSSPPLPFSSFPSLSLPLSLLRPLSLCFTLSPLSLSFLSLSPSLPLLSLSLASLPLFFS